MAIGLPIVSDPLQVTHHRNIAASRQIFVPTISTAILSIHNNSIFMIATDALIMTLPLASAIDPGFIITFVHAMAAGGALLTIQTVTPDAIWGTIVNDAGSGAVFTSNGTSVNNIKLTKATSKVGNGVTLVSSGGTDWYIVPGSGSGIWTN